MEYQYVKDDFRAFLQLEFSKRCKQNMQYSLRAFAASLDIDASSLSQFLRNKRNISEKKMRGIALKIGLNEDEFMKFVAQSNNNDFYTIASDHFMVLSEWYHLAICELCNLSDFQYDTKWISKKIGVQEINIVAAIERLKRINWVKEDKGVLIYNGGDITTVNSDISLSARSTLQKQMLVMASEAMDTYPAQERSQTGMTMAISKDKVDQANVMITKFRRKLCKFLEDTELKDDVYHLSISLFPLTKQ
jgi:uncharacterized protein (TIGR02147 family)